MAPLVKEISFSSGIMYSRVQILNVTAGRILSILLVCVVSLWAQQDPTAKKDDTFFAGTASEWTSEKIVVSRSVAAKTEQRTFRITPETKVEGKPRAKVRVTVRYTTDEDGDIAMLIVVRAPVKQK
jgi:hypothetical protein